MPQAQNTAVGAGTPHPAIFTMAGTLAGARACALLSLPVVPFGMALGLAAGEKGISFLEIMLMSAVVFAGLSQLAAVELWAAPLPVLPIILITFTVNIRHVLYGAALSTWVRGVAPWQRNLAGGLMSDMNWALTIQAKERGQNDVGFLFGSGLVLWAVWLAGTAAGHQLGSSVPDPKALGLDAVVIALFATTLVGLWKGTDDLAPWLVAAVAALLAHAHLPAGWHIMIGALAGGLAGVARYGR
ncbi:MAG: AzlC family ABC transporter permease [Hyphomicrobiaceae bacterium]